MARDPDLLTAGDVAALCGAAVRTVHKWFNAGLLAGYRLPDHRGLGTPGDRRISRGEVERFLLANGMADLAGRLYRLRRKLILGVGLTEAREQSLKAALDGRFALECSPAFFRAGLLWEKRRHAVVLIDGSRLGVTGSLIELEWLVGLAAAVRVIVLIVPDDLSQVAVPPGVITAASSVSDIELAKLLVEKHDKQWRPKLRSPLPGRWGRRNGGE